MNRIVLILMAALIGVVLGLIALVVILRQRPIPTLASPPQHGASFVFDVDWSGTAGDTNTLAELKKAICERFDRFGVRIFWEPVSESRIRVAVPIENLGDAVAAEGFITRRGILEFHSAYDESTKLVERGEVLADFERLWVEKQPGSDPVRRASFLVRKQPALAGNIIKNAKVVEGPQGDLRIAVGLNTEGTQAFAQITRANVGQRLAVLLDGRLRSAPVILTPIEAGLLDITGILDRTEATRLAMLLERPLPVPTKLVESSVF